MISANDIMQVLCRKRFVLTNEKVLQGEIESILKTEFPTCNIEREFHLDKDNIIDFVIDGHLGIEVKIKGSKRALYSQCVRYCDFDQIKSLLLITTLSIGFPAEINGKDCYVQNLSKAWL